MTGDVYVPGLWECAKCNFTLVQSVMNANTGAISAQDKPGEPCPNCSSPLWRVTWKKHAHEMSQRCEEQLARAVKAEADLKASREALYRAAPSHQGGHSDTGYAIAQVLGLTFPLGFPELEAKAAAEGFDTRKLWPWLYRTLRAPRR